MALTSQDRPLGVQEAYDALDAFGRSAGRVPLLLLLHAAVPQSFRADLVNLLKLNFLASEAGTDMTVDADVLLSPLVQPAAGNYYRLDAEVRRHCLALLDAAYRDRPMRRSVEVAWFLMAYAEALEDQAGLALDPLLAEYLDVQRWVAASFIDPGGSASTFARAIADRVASGRTTASALLGSITAAISVPLSGHEGLMAYARGLDAVERGDADAATRLLEWTRDDELIVGGVTLRPGRELLARVESRGGDTSSAAQSQTATPAQDGAATRTATAGTTGPLRINVPPPPVRSMAGRVRELELARALLTRPVSEDAPRRGPRVVRIVGEEGMGKWTLANAIVHRTDVPAHFPDGVVWLGEDGNGYPTEALVAYGNAVGVTDLLDDRQSVRAERLKQLLADRRTLLVVDQRSAADIVGTVIDNAGPDCAVLHLVVADRTDNPSRVVLEPLPAEDANLLIGMIDQSSVTPISDLIKFAGGNALLLSLAFSVRQVGAPLQRESEIPATVERLVESIWRRAPRTLRDTALRAIETLRPRRTLLTKTELAELSPSGGESLVSALQRLRLATDLGEVVRIHPRVRAALIEAGLQMSEEESASDASPQKSALRTDDYALIVGINQYVGLDLYLPGPMNAASAMAAWLSSPEGGLPPDNVTLLMQDSVRSGDPQPSHDRIEKALVTLAESVQPGRRNSPPRRLYLCFFGAVINGAKGDIGLVTAEATRVHTRTIGILEWRRYFLEGPFEEVVFMIDGVNAQQPSPITTEAVPLSGHRTREATSMLTLMAVSPSVFSQPTGNLTAVLLEGLRGAAVSFDGRITSASLASFVDKAMRGRVSEDVPPQVPVIEYEGEIVFSDTAPPPVVA